MQSNRKYAQVLYDFNGRSDYDDEFSVKKGDVLQILFEINNDWLCVKSLMKFKLLNEEKFSGGIVPKNYLKQFEISDNQLNQQFYLAIDDFGLEDNNNNFYFYKIINYFPLNAVKKKTVIFFTNRATCALCIHYTKVKK